MLANFNKNWIPLPHNNIPLKMWFTDSRYKKMLQATLLIAYIFDLICLSEVKCFRVIECDSISESRELLANTGKYDLTLDPKYEYMGIQHHYHPLRESTDFYSSAYTSKVYSKGNRRVRILINLRQEICQLIFFKKYKEAVEKFKAYEKEVQQHIDFPSGHAEQHLEIPLKHLLGFINATVGDYHAGKALQAMFRRDRGLWPFRLRDVVVADSDFALGGFRREELKRRLEDCSLQGLSVLFERHKKSVSYAAGTTWTFDDALIATLLYSINVEKVEGSRSRGSLSRNVMERVCGLKLTDFIAHYERGIIPLACLLKMDITPCTDRSALMAPFRREVRRIIEGKCSENTPDNLEAWVEMFEKHGILGRVTDDNYRITFENFLKYISLVNIFPFFEIMLNESLKTYNYIVPFKINNIMVPYSHLESDRALSPEDYGPDETEPGMKRFSECTLQEIIFLLHKYVPDVNTWKRGRSRILFVNLFLLNIAAGNISGASLNCPLPSFMIKTAYDLLHVDQLISLHERGLIPCRKDY